MAVRSPLRPLHLPLSFARVNNRGMEPPSQITANAVAPWSRPVFLVPVFGLVSVVGGLFPSFSLEANLYVLAIGGVMTWLGLSGRLPRRPESQRLGAGAAWWLVPALLLALVELVSAIYDSTPAHPTISLLLDPILDLYLARAIAYFLWLGAFWSLVRR